MQQFALFAGSAAAAIFMISQLPMLIKARRTKDLTSYSFTNIGLANVGNVLYAVYVLQVPVGPVWATHGFNLATSGLMLLWYLRYGWRSPAMARRAVRNRLEESSSARSTSDVGPHDADGEVQTKGLEALRPSSQLTNPWSRSRQERPCTDGLHAMDPCSAVQPAGT